MAKIRRLSPDEISDLGSEFTENSDPNFAKRLLLAIGDETTHAFARRARIPDSSLRNYLNGSMPGLKKLLQIAEAAGVTLDWLISGAGPMRPGAELRPVSEGFSLIPRLDIRAAAGAGAHNSSEESSEALPFPTDLLRMHGVNPRTARLLQSSGDSMVPTILDGDMLLVDTSMQSFVDDSIYVLVFAGRTLVKRLQMLRSGDILIKSDNKELFEDETVPADEVPQINVAGRVKWYGRWI